MTEKNAKEEIYYYGGYILFTDNKLGHAFYNLEDNLIAFSSRSFHFAIGFPFTITRHSEDKFTYKPNREVDSAPHEKINEWKIRSNANKQKYKEILANKRMKEESHKLNKMTINEIRDYCKGNIERKRTIKAYLEEKLFW